MKYKIVYKVVSLWPQGIDCKSKPLRCSAVISPSDQDFYPTFTSRCNPCPTRSGLYKNLSVTYRPGRWVGGKGRTPVMAFETIEQSVKFAVSCARNAGGPFVEIWRAQAIKAQEKLILARIYLPMTVPGLKKIWRNPSSRTIKPPEGTVICKHIRLLERTHTSHPETKAKTFEAVS